MDSPTSARSSAENWLQPWSGSSDLDAPDDAHRHSSSSSSSGSLHSSMARLEDEFRSILRSRVSPLSLPPSPLALSPSPSFNHADAQPPLERSDTRSTASHRSLSCIRDTDLIPLDAAHDLHSIADRMVSAGFSRECSQAYSSVRKASVDSALKRLGIEKLSISDVHRLPWDSLESKIRRWIPAAKSCVRVVFAGERRLFDLVFDGVEFGPADGDPFSDTVKSAAVQLFGFAEAVSIVRRSPEKLFKILDLHDALSELLPDVADVFSPSSSVHTQVSETLSRLEEAARGMLSEFENAVHSELARTPVPGGTVHPLTRYVMNYISLMSDYKILLSQMIVSFPNWQLGDSVDESRAPLPEINLNELENPSPLPAHLFWIIKILDSNLDGKSRLYKDPALGHLFVMNNVYYIVQKVKGLQELRELVGDDCLRSLTRKYLQAATSYQRVAWGRVLHFLRDEGIHVSGSFSSGVSKGTLKERFKSFNAAFDEAHRTQAAWSVPDMQLREELRISVSEKLLPAYRSFLGRYRHHIENGRHPEMYIKYSVEDLETALADFFEGLSPSQLGRRRSQ